eukprot:UN2021
MFPLPGWPIFVLGAVFFLPPPVVFEGFGDPVGGFFFLGNIFFPGAFFPGSNPMGVLFFPEGGSPPFLGGLYKGGPFHLVGFLFLGGAQAGGGREGDFTFGLGWVPG